MIILEVILNIETKRCRIRQFKQSDVDELYLILSNPKVMEYIEAPFTLEDTKDFLNGILAKLIKNIKEEKYK